MPPLPDAPGTTRQSIAFIVPVHNDATGLERCLSAISSNDCQEAAQDVIVVDNRSGDGSAQKAVELGATVVSMGGKVAALRNQGARLTRASLLAFVDADHHIDSGWVRCALELFADPTVGAVGAPYLPPSDGTWVQHTYNAMRDHRSGVHDAGWLGSGNLVVRRECFEALGGFDETLETCEDVDLCRRLRARGYRVLSDSRLRSIHYGDPRTLHQLFISELWRGRDNLRVSLSRRPSVRELPSVLIPIVNLLCLVAALAAVMTWQWAGALPAIVAIAALSGLRAARMAQRLGARRLPALVRAWSVALVYDAARALALVTRMPHRRVTLPTRAPA